MTEIIKGIFVDARSLSVPFICKYENGYIKAFIKRGWCVTGCDAVIHCDEDDKILVFSCEYDGINGDYDCFALQFRCDPGLYYLTFRIATDTYVFYVHNTGDEMHGEFRENINICGRFQLLITEKYPDISPEFKNGNMYQIFVDRFYKSGKSPRRNDAVYYDDWDNGIPEYAEYPGMHLENNTFFGGDLYGVTEKLEYIKDLGCDIIYLCPIFEAYSNHKYDTGNYAVVDKCFGGEDAFVQMCEKAHSLGMQIILDGVFNHTGENSLYFNKYKKYGDGGAYNSKNSPYYSWYSFINYPDDYDCWWGIKMLPRLCSYKPEVLEYFTGKDGIIRRYLRLGADGWRLDVADELSEEILDNIKKAAEAEKPGSIVIGEVWEDATTKIAYGKRRHYFSHAQLDSVMDYPLKDAIIGYVQTGNTKFFRHAFTEVYRHYPEHVKECVMNFLGTHDTERIITVLGGDPAGDLPGSVLAHKRMNGEQYEYAKKLFFAAFSLLCFCPGICSVFYGDETGLQGYRDPFNRMPFPWGREDEEVRSTVSSLLKLRKQFCGDLRILYAQNGLLILQRTDHIYISNMSNTDKYVYAGDYSDINGNIYDGEICIKSRCYVILKKQRNDNNDQAV